MRGNWLACWFLSCIEWWSCIKALLIGDGWEFLCEDDPVFKGFVVSVKNAFLFFEVLIVEVYTPNSSGHFTEVWWVVFLMIYQLSWAIWDDMTIVVVVDLCEDSTKASFWCCASGWSIDNECKLMVQPCLGHNWVWCEGKLNSSESLLSIWRDGASFVFWIFAAEFGQCSTDKQKVPDVCSEKNAQANKRSDHFESCWWFSVFDWF